MRVDPNLLNTVMFLCEDREDDSGNPRKIPAATAFLVRVEEARDDKLLTWKYLVTAHHNIERAVGTIYIRYNSSSGGVDHFESLKTEWIASDDSDVSCLPFWSPERPRPDIKHASFLLSELVGKDGTFSGPSLTEASTPSHVGLGDDLAFVGLFSKRPGTSRNVPIVRFGNVSAMPGDPITVTLGDEENAYNFDVVGYLAECKSWGGHSGSPVLWTTTRVGRVIEGEGMKGPKQSFLHTGLLGLVSAHFDIEQKAHGTGEMPAEIRTAINSGIAVVTPASKIIELLEREDVVDERKSQT